MAKYMLENMFLLLSLLMFPAFMECSTRSLHVDTVEFPRTTGGSLMFKLEGDDFVIGTSQTDILRYDSQNRTTESSGSLLLPGGLEVYDSLVSQDTPQWKLWSLDTFETDETTWSNAAFSSCGISSDTFLGGHCKFGHTETARQFEDLPEHKMLRIAARVHYFDQWTGQSVYMKVGNEIVWTGSWNWCPEVFSMECIKNGVDVCGHEYPDRMSVAVDVQIPHKNGSVQISFGSTIKQESDPCIASYGVDDVALYLI